MTLRDVRLPVSYEWGCQHALIFSSEIANGLGKLHERLGRPDCCAMPAMLTDGRFMLTADILNAVEPGGYLAAMWAAADQAKFAQAVEVVPIAEAMALLPPPLPLGQALGMDAQNIDQAFREAATL